MEEGSISDNIKNIIKNASSGMIAGTSCAISGHPFDTVKVKMQVFPDYYKGTMDCVSSIVKKSGIRGLYKGFVPAMSSNMSENAVLFIALPSCCKFSQFICDKISPIPENASSSYLEKRSTFVNIMGGSFAGIFAAFAIAPNEMVKCRMQALIEKKALGLIKSEMNMIEVVRDIVKTDGYLGIFRGLSTTIMREFPGYFLIFGGYETTNYLLSPYNMGSTQYMISGGIGGVTYWATLYPIDVIKSRIQVLNMEGKKPRFYEYIKHVYNTEGGMKALYSGILPTITRAFFANATLFYTYELCQDYFYNK